MIEFAGFNEPFVDCIPKTNVAESAEVEESELGDVAGLDDDYLEESIIPQSIYDINNYVVYVAT